MSSFTTRNKFSSLDSSESELIPETTSTPAKKKPLKTAVSENRPLKIALINFQSIRGKKPQFYSFVEINNPNVIVGTETWLTSEIYSNEYFPPELGYTVYRRDRSGQRNMKIYGSS